jgi:hypothetical protein
MNGRISLRGVVRDPVFLTTIFTVVGIIVIHLIPVPERAPTRTVEALQVAAAPEACPTPAPVTRP